MYNTRVRVAPTGGDPRASTSLGGLDCIFNTVIRVHDAEEQVYPGDDYGNACLHPSMRYHVHAVHNYLNREFQPRLPWHDIGLSLDGYVESRFACVFLAPVC